MHSLSASQNTCMQANIFQTLSAEDSSLNGRQVAWHDVLAVAVSSSCVYQAHEHVLTTRSRKGKVQAGISK